jgi:hypothetical protein
MSHFDLKARAGSLATEIANEYFLNTKSLAATTLNRKDAI